MPTAKRPRKGSLQFWPRKRVSKFLPRVNWSPVISENKESRPTGILGFIAYKAGMTSAIVKDNTEHSRTKGKRIAVPATILECPTMKIFSIRFYKNGTVMTEILAENLEKELKRKVKLPKTKVSKNIDEIKDYDDVSVIVYSLVKKADLKKTPDLSEIGLSGDIQGKLNWIKEHLTKEISVSEIFKNGDLIDARGLTRGKGLVGPLKRFGLKLKNHKSEKGRRRPGSLAPWHPARVTFRAPMAGQLGMFTRVVYNNKIIDLGKAEGKFNNIKNYGDVKSEYVVVKGSIQGPSKRQIILTAALRPTKRKTKHNFELVEYR